MNAQPSPTPPVPMTKEKVLKDDGRFLYYYTFEEAPQTPTPGEPESHTEDVDV